MGRKTNHRLHPDIKAARRAAAKANSACRRTIRRVQSECTHDVVAHADWRPGSYFRSLPGLRVCLKCGFEECIRYGTMDYWAGAKTTRFADDLSYEEKYGPTILGDKAVMPGVNPWKITL